MTLEELHSNVVALCSKLIRAQSCSGEEGGAAGAVRSAMHQLGYDEITVDVYGNVIGCIHGSLPGPRILLDGHIDTVPVQEPERWSFDPFGGEIRADRVCGRGASDMKGAVAAMICAAAAYAENCGRRFHGDLYVAGVVYEEMYEGVAARKIGELVNPNYVIIGEASNLNLKIGQRGRAEIVVETIGRPAHSANPEKGVNAVKSMMRLLEALEDDVPEEQPDLGRGILELTDIISAPYPGASVVPERCTATFDRRLLAGETPQSVLAPVQKHIDALSARDPAFKAKAYFRSETRTCYTGSRIFAERFFPAWRFRPDEDFVEKTHAALKTIDGDCALTYYSFCTNGSHYAGERGIRTLGYGPSQEHLAHTVDEYILIEQLEKCAEGYMKIIEVLSNM